MEESGRAPAEIVEAEGLAVIADSDALTLNITRSGACPPTAEQVTVLLPRQETRPVRTDSARVVADRISGDWRELRLALD